MERINIELSGGRKVVARPLSPLDYAAAGAPPKSKPDDDDPDWISYGSQIQRIVLLRCIGPIRDGGKETRVVDKPWDLCKPGEMAPEDLEVEDLVAITGAVMNHGKALREAMDDAGFREGEPEGAD